MVIKGLIGAVLLLVGVAANAQEATYDIAIDLQWVPPTLNTDGTPLTDLATYNIYWGSTSPNAMDGYNSPISILAGGTTYTMNLNNIPITEENIWVSMTALDSEDPVQESAQSNLVMFGPFDLALITVPGSASGITGTVRVVRCPDGYNCVPN